MGGGGIFFKARKLPRQDHFILTTLLFSRRSVVFFSYCCGVTVATIIAQKLLLVL